MWKFVMATLLFVLFGGGTAEAACSGSGHTWTCTAGSTIANINSAIGSASDGATITFESGNYSWSSGTINNFSNSKGVTLICAARGACVVTISTGLVLNLTYSGTNNKLYRISGFHFKGTCSSGFCIHVHHASAGGSGTLQNLRIDNNTFDGMGNSGNTVLIFVGATDRGGNVYGVIDHNIVTDHTAHILYKVLGDTDVPDRPWGPSSRGTGQAMYIEDNTLTFTTGGAALYHCADSWRSGKYVWRFNTSTNCRVATHGLPHGGVALWEVYRNSITGSEGQSGSWTDCWRCIQSQGSGEIYVFQNNIRGLNGNVSNGAIVVQHYRSDSGQPGQFGVCDGTKSVDGNWLPIQTYRGYPCLAQPGRMEVGGSPRWGKLAPMFAFGNINSANGSKRDLTTEGSNYLDVHVKADRDFYNAVSANMQTSPTSPFNGTTGMGYGTLANRPPTCAHPNYPDGDNGGGVMYWATDQGSWNSMGESGVLYRCSATNTWTVHYTPYQYPHPLQRSQDTGTPPPGPPTNLRIIS
jgi:hypothetical protein